MIAPQSASAQRALQAAESLIADGNWSDAVVLLTDAERREPDPAIEIRLVEARHRMFDASDAPKPHGDWPPSVPDVFAGVDGIPEVAAADLRVEHLAAGVQHHGALLVRGLLPPEVAGSLLDQVQRSFDAAEAAANGAPVWDTAPWYVPFEAADGYEFGWIERSFSRQVGAVLAVEAPRALLHAIDALRGAGLGEVLAEYLGEWPALSAKKTTLRRARPGHPPDFHQDGAFLGDGIRAVNVWTALTDCGIDAPSVQVYADPFAEIVPTGTDNADFSWSVSDAQAARLGARQVVQPCFAAGDALLFDQLTLHRTGTSPAMTRDRYAVESWFFAPSTYPYEQVPVAF